MKINSDLQMAVKCECHGCDQRGWFQSTQFNQGFSVQAISYWQSAVHFEFCNCRSRKFFAVAVGVTSNLLSCFCFTRNSILGVTLLTMEQIPPQKELVFIVNPPFGTRQTDLIHAFANENSLGTTSDLAQMAIADGGLTAAQVEDMSVKTFLMSIGMCLEELMCEKKSCGVWMKIVWLNDSHFGFRCSKCKTTASMFRGTFLEGFQAPVWKIPYFFFGVSGWRNYTQRAIAESIDVDKNTVSQWAVWMRESLAVFNGNQEVKLGGPGETVYLDEVSNDRLRFDR